MLGRICGCTLEFYILDDPVIGESGYKLWPCLIVRWQGKISKKVKDKGSFTEWISVKGYKSKVKSQQEIYLRVKDYIVSHNINTLSGDVGGINYY